MGSLFFLLHSQILNSSDLIELTSEETNQTRKTQDVMDVPWRGQLWKWRGHLCLKAEPGSSTQLFWAPQGTHRIQGLRNTDIFLFSLFSLFSLPFSSLIYPSCLPTHRFSPLHADKSHLRSPSQCRRLGQECVCACSSDPSLPCPVTPLRTLWMLSQVPVWPARDAAPAGQQKVPWMSLQLAPGEEMVTAHRRFPVKSQRCSHTLPPAWQTQSCEGLQDLSRAGSSSRLSHTQLLWQLSPPLELLCHFQLSRLWWGNLGRNTHSFAQPCFGLGSITSCRFMLSYK